MPKKDTAPTGAEFEAISVIASNYGPLAVERLGLKIKRFEDTLRAHGAQLDPGKLRADFLTIRAPGIMRQRFICVDRRAKLCGILRQDPPAVLSAGDLIRSIILAAMGQAGIDELRRFVAAAEDRMSARLAHAETRIAEATNDLSTPYTHHQNPTVTHPGGGCTCQDRYIARALPWIEERAVLADTLSTLAAARTAAVASTGDAVTKAIADAGGADVVSNGVRESWAIAGDPNGEDVAARELAGVQGDIAQIDSQLAKLGITADQAAKQTGTYAATLPPRRADLVTRAAALQGEATGRKEASVSSVVAGASAGDEVMRSLLEATVRNLPTAFPVGFADALNGCQWLLSPAAESIIELAVSCYSMIDLFITDSHSLIDWNFSRNFGELIAKAAPAGRLRVINPLV